MEIIIHNDKESEMPHHKYLISDDLNETIKHGTDLFNFAVYDITSSDYAILLAHWHHEYEIVYLECGEITFNVGDREVLLHAGEVLFINHHHVHSAYSRHKGVIRYISIRDAA